MVYGVVNGKECFSRDEFIFEKRGFEEITSDTELLKYAEKVTSNWQKDGHKHSFIGFYLGDYALDEPKASLTDSEYKRLKALQEQKKYEWEEEQAKYKWENFEGRDLTESEVRMFLDRRVKMEEDRWGENHFYTQQMKDYRDKTISEFRNGKVVEVDNYEYTAKFGNGLGDFSKALYSDGTIKDCCYGSID